MSGLLRNVATNSYSWQVSVSPIEPKHSHTEASGGMGSSLKIGLQTNIPTTIVFLSLAQLLCPSIFRYVDCRFWTSTHIFIDVFKNHLEKCSGEKLRCKCKISPFWTCISYWKLQIVQSARDSCPSFAWAGETNQLDAFKAPGEEKTQLYLWTHGPGINYLEQPFINGCFNWMIPNLYIEHDCFTISIHLYMVVWGSRYW